MTQDYIPMTPETIKEIADGFREEGLPELGEVFDSIADKVAHFNEINELTIEEARERLGEEKFWQLLRGDIQA